MDASTPKSLLRLADALIDVHAQFANDDPSKTRRDGDTRASYAVEAFDGATHKFYSLKEIREWILSQILAPKE